MNQASFQEMFICKYKLLIAARRIVQGMKGLLLHSKTQEVSQFVTPIQDVRRTLMGKVTGE